MSVLWWYSAMLLTALTIGALWSCVGGGEGGLRPTSKPALRIILLFIFIPAFSGLWLFFLRAMP